MLIKGWVKNKSPNWIVAGGRVFPPHTTTFVSISKTQWKEVTGKKRLEIVNSQEEIKIDNSTTKHSFSCPFCDEYSGETEKGLQMHIRLKHYEEGGGGSDKDQNSQSNEGN